MADTRKAKGQYFADSNGLHPSIESTFGPWDSIEAFEEWLGGMGSSVSIPNGLPIAVKGSDGRISIKRWTVPNVPNAVPYWKNESGESPVIPIAGVIEVGRSKGSSSIDEGNSSNVYYIENHEVLGLVPSGSTSDSVVEYYPIWKGCLEYGVVGNGEVTPLENKLYLDTSTGQLFYASDSEVDPYISDDIEELLDEVRRLKGYNIRFSGDSLIVYDATSKTDKVYNLAEGREESGEDEYETPQITLAYPASVSADAKSLSPSSFLVTQAYTPVKGTPGTLRYSTVASLQSVAGAGNVAFSMAEGSDPAFSVNAQTGVVSISANASGSARSGAVTLSVTLNGKTAEYTAATITQNVPLLYITAVEYPEADALDSYTEGAKTVAAADINITDSTGATYSLATYLAKSTSTEREAVSFECTRSYGSELNGETGALSYNPKSIFTNFDSYVIQSGEGKGSIGSIEIAVKQNGRADIAVLFNMFRYADVNSLESATALSGFGGSTDSSSTTTIKAKSGCSLITGISVTAGDVVLFNLPDAGHWNWVWETSSNVTGAATAKRGVASSAFGTSAMMKVLNTGVLSIGYYDSYKPVSYKIVEIS